MTIGRGSFLSELVERAGGREPLRRRDQRPPAPVSIEAVAARDPDLILTTTEGPAAFAEPARMAGGARGARAPLSPGERLGVQPAESRASPAAIRELARADPRGRRR